MGVRVFSGGLVLAAGALLLPVVVHGQAPPPPITNPPASAKKCKANSKDAACQAPVPSSSTSTPSPAADNPFPVEDSRHGGDAEGTAPPPSAPAPSAKGTAPGTLAGDDADPPSESNKPMKLPKDGYSSGEPSSSSTPGDAAGTSSSHAADDDVAPTTEAPDAPVKSSKLKDLGSSGSFSEAHAKLEKTRFNDDLKVGKFYLQDGNPQGAYLRYKDAIGYDPDDPDALFGLAQAAEKLKKRDEAILNYRETIKADPGGDHDRAARAALKDLGAKPE
jgi:hypothetical protein